MREICLIAGQEANDLLGQAGHATVKRRAGERTPIQRLNKCSRFNLATSRSASRVGSGRR